MAYVPTLTEYRHGQTATCAGVGCSREFELSPSGRGSVRRFCSERCKARAEITRQKRRRAQAARRKAEAKEAARHLTVVPDIGDDDSPPPRRDRIGSYLITRLPDGSLRTDYEPRAEHA